MIQFIPVRGVIQRLQDVGLEWPVIAEDLRTAHVMPVPGYDTRQRYVGALVEAFVEPGAHEGEPVMWVIGMRRRIQGEPLPRELQVVGHGAKTRKSNRKGGSGQRWPTTWDELLARIDAHPDTEIRRGGKHLSVLYRGKQVQTLPLTASDHRALLNACQTLRSAGIDVRRKV